MPAVKEKLPFGPLPHSLPSKPYVPSTTFRAVYHVSQETWNGWVKAGLKVRKPGTKYEYVRPGWVFRFWDTYQEPAK